MAAIAASAIAAAAAALSLMQSAASDFARAWSAKRPPTSGLLAVNAIC